MENLQAQKVSSPTCDYARNRHDYWRVLYGAFTMVEYTYVFVVAVQYKVKVRATGLNEAIEKFKKICNQAYTNVYRVK
jgi:hypothetical protein